MIQVKIGTTGWRDCPTGIADAGYVTFNGTFVYDTNGKTPLMVWDGTILPSPGNIRAMTAPEIAVLPAQKILADHPALVAALTDNTNFIAKLITGPFLAALDEINILRAAIPHPITSITRVTTVATVTTPTAHGKIAGDPISIMGADVAGYNLTTTVATAPTGTTFTYTMGNAGVTPATGSMFYTNGAVPQTPPRTKAQLRNASASHFNAGDADS